MSVFGNGKDITKEFYDKETKFSKFMDGLVLRRGKNFTLLAAFPGSGIYFFLSANCPFFL